MDATTRSAQPALLGAFADLLSYPADDPVPAARRCRDLAGRRGTAQLLATFLSRAERARPHEMEELYSSTFDLDTACAPYVGHHLCGESPRRGAFMARLADVYREDGFLEASTGGELPDHLTVILRYLSAVPSGEKREALVAHALLPALDTMLAGPLDPDNAYRSVLAALREEVSR